MQSAKQKVLENFKKTYCRLRPSKVQGVGVFAVRDIPKGANPFFGAKEKKWIKMRMEDFKKSDKEVLQMIDDFFVIEKDGSIYVPEDGLNGINISFFVNHSKKPNLKVVGDGEKEEIKFVAARKIKKGEELTAFYGAYDDKYKK